MIEKSWVDRVLAPTEYVSLSFSERVNEPEIPIRHCAGCGTRMSQYHPDSVTLCYPCQDARFETEDLSVPMSAAKTVTTISGATRTAQKNERKARLLAAMEALGTFTLFDVAKAAGIRWQMAHPVVLEAERHGKVIKTRGIQKRGQTVYAPSEWRWVE